MTGAGIVGAAGIAVIVAGLVYLVAVVRGGPVLPDNAPPTCAECGHRSSEHRMGTGRCLVETGGSRDRYDGGGNWVGWWNPTHCACSGYRGRGERR
ncbi:hypothetical protein ACWGRF_09645 [Streptomyces zhihengii]